MSITLTEILERLGKVEGFAEQLAQAGADIREKAAQEKDAKKREKLIEACDKRDAAAVRDLWFSAGE